MEYWSKRLITDGLIFLEVNKDAAIFFLKKEVRMKTETRIMSMEAVER